MSPFGLKLRRLRATPCGVSVQRFHRSGNIDPPMGKSRQPAQARSGKTQSRAVLSRIVLKRPKITRRLATEWFARCVDERYRRCLANDAA